MKNKDYYIFKKINQKFTIVIFSHIELYVKVINLFFFYMLQKSTKNPITQEKEINLLLI